MLLEQHICHVQCNADIFVSSVLYQQCSNCSVAYSHATHKTNNNTIQIDTQGKGVMQFRKPESKKNHTRITMLSETCVCVYVCVCVVCVCVCACLCVCVCVQGANTPLGARKILSIEEQYEKLRDGTME